MRCLNCGTENNERNLNCSNCGADLSVNENKNIFKNKKFLISVSAVLVLVIIGLASIINSIIIPNNAAEKMRNAFDSKNGENVISVFTEYCGDYSVDYNSLSKAGEAVYSEFKSCISTAKDDLNNQPVGTDINNYLIESTGDIILPQEYSAVTTIGEYNADLNTIAADYYNLYSSKISYTKGMELYEEKNYVNAIDSFSNVTEEDSWYEDAQAKLNECQEKLLEEKIASIEKSIKDGNYDSAQDEINSLRSENLTDEMNKKLDECETKIYEAKLAKIDEYVNIGDLEAANEYIESLGDGLSDEAQERLKQAIKNKANNYIAKADEALKSGERQGAYDMAVMAQNLCPDDDEIAKKVEYFKEYLPFKLYLTDNALSYKQNIYQSNVYWNQASTSNSNEAMGHSLVFSYIHVKTDTRYTITYKLDKKFNKLNGTGFVTDDYKNVNQKGYFKIYGDGKTIYTSPKFTANVMPQKFSIDISKIDVLKIEFYGSVDDGLGQWTEYGISNFVATKNLP